MLSGNFRNSIKRCSIRRRYLHIVLPHSYNSNFDQDLINFFVFNNKFNEMMISINLNSCKFELTIFKSKFFVIFKST